MAGAEPTTFRRFDTASGPSNQVKRGTWSAAEDARLRAAVNEYGFRWVLVAQKVQTRNGDQCAKRWNEKLDPKLDHSPWTPEEVRILDSHTGW
ncbi:Myb-like protein AA [Penicillium rolfsii]|nr:Myb-like protein AA [Penicillium rolfsii]